MQNDKIWRDKFNSVVLYYELSKDEKVHCNFESLYIKLEKLGDCLIKQGVMPCNASYDIPLEDGTSLQMSFTEHNNEYRALLSLLTPQGEKMTLVSENDLASHEYQVLHGYTVAKTLGVEGVGIGHRFPDSLPEILLKEFLPGRIITFDGIDCMHQKAYVCSESFNGMIKMKALTLGNYRDISAKSFMAAEEKTLLVFNSPQLQKFYNEIKTLTGNVFPRTERIDCFAQEQINKLMSVIKPGKTAILKIGKDCLRLQRSLLGNNFFWYDRNGERITEDAAKVFIAWCHNAPIAVSIENEAKLLGSIHDYEAYSEYERCLIKRDYTLAAKQLEALCINKDKDFSVNIYTYANETDTPTATSFCFKAQNGKCEVFKVLYNDNDFNKEPRSISRVSLDDYALFCQDKYKSIVNALYHNIVDLYKSRYPNPAIPQNVATKIFDHAAHKEIEKATQSKDIIEATNITDIKPQINTLIASFLNYTDEDQSPIIYDKTIGRCHVVSETDER